MDVFSVRDLREHTGQLIHDAEAGKLSLVTKRGHPVFLAVPFNETLLSEGLTSALAIQLFQEHIISLGKAAKLAAQSLPDFINTLGKLHIPVADYTAEELANEVKHFE
jgi:predicted HTH domain antitoxin